MEYLLCAPLYLVILIIGCEGDPFSSDKSFTLPHGHNVEWMKSISNEILLSAVTIPGTYESMKRHFHDQHQAWELKDQFNAGVRFFDISLAGSVVKDVFLTKKQKFADVMNEMTNHLTMHSQEVIIIRVTPTNDKAKKEISRFLKDNRNVWKDAKVPKMKDVRGKIVFVQNPSKLNKGLTVRIHVGGERLKSEDESMKKITKHLKEAENAVDYLVVTETNYGKSSAAEKNAKKINQRIKQESQRPKCLGVIVMDFGFELIQKIIDFNPKAGDSPEFVEEEAEIPPEGDEEGK
ncbi:hypothetical protein SKAU_G00221560 [Synaphobranchus kaupii]|uniref:Uncharacterized protein n=1 Tax=Synaphobranchus kaupii TaxID=118154 RepID=A0A9Q1IVJ5_SYNKA|nr:hypothetical protein SKAU_G00221560 [Synaphobranchus kaupii]